MIGDKRYIPVTSKDANLCSHAYYLIRSVISRVPGASQRQFPGTKKITVRKENTRKEGHSGYKKNQDMHACRVCRASPNTCSGGYLTLDKLSLFREETVSRSAASLVLNCTRLAGVAEQFPRPTLASSHMGFADYMYYS